jgi:hypothetical protein
VDEKDYANCTQTSAAMADAKLASGVTVTPTAGATTTGYTVSEDVSGSGNTFKITKDNTGAYTRTCGQTATFATKGKGGCPSSGLW